jgi:hypothetical protein
MKKALLSLAIIATLGAKAQVQSFSATKFNRVGIVKQGPTITVCELQASDKSSYMLTYFNAKYPSLHTYETLSFDAKPEEIEVVYSAFKNAFESDDIKEYHQIVVLGNASLSVAGRKMLGSKYIIMLTDRGHTLPMTENQVDKLFNKK